MYRTMAFRRSLGSCANGTGNEQGPASSNQAEVGAMGIDALIFDVDGTLADTEEAHRTAFNEAFQHFGLGWTWTRPEYRDLLAVTGGKERLASYVATLGLQPAETTRLLALIPDIHAAKTAFYGARITSGEVPLRDGIARLLDEALRAGCQLAIATTTTAADVDALLESALGARGADLFSVIGCGDQVAAKKPAPDIYRLVLDALETQPDRAIAFEDSIGGLRSAVGAGLWTVITPTFWTEGGDFSAAGLVLPRLGDPEHPLPDEPGNRLRAAAWLTLDELLHRAAMAAG